MGDHPADARPAKCAGPVVESAREGGGIGGEVAQVISHDSVFAIGVATFTTPGMPARSPQAALSGVLGEP
jgi:NADH dehydrogenase FAD-containing subunit